MTAGYTATALDSNQAVFQGSGIQHTGKGHFNVHGNVNITPNPPPDSREDEECMKALFMTDPSEDRAMLKRKKGNRASGTCEWIAQTEKLNTWLHFEETEQKSQSNNILWLHGNPGTGKSTMAIFLTEELSTSFHGKENMTLAYFFCDASFEKQKTATSIVRGLLYLLVQKHKNLLSSLLKTATEGETSECVAIRRILSFVAISFEALSVRALSEACQLHQDEPDLDTRLQYTRDQIASCRFLVVVYDQKVQLLHKSVRDFLTGSGSDFFVERLEAHASAASCCIDNLIKRLHDENPPEGPLLDYAIDYWTYHEFIEFLVQEGGAHIVITDEIMEAVSDANSPGYKHQIACMELFFRRRRQLRFTDKAFAIIREFVQTQLSESELSEDEEENLTTAGELEELLLEE
ncbi:pfs domain-containing protein [Trichoderma harzianum]|uniref:Pfs domain-containing protein n=1 Tax=Trichoderma harzianum TaxID=5544 RepID=A0A0F9XJA7_TRIHA|nr:pfs domain-containing protein [Trichoderma harzianum]